MCFVLKFITQRFDMSRYFLLVLFSRLRFVMKCFNFVVVTFTFLYHFSFSWVSFIYFFSHYILTVFWGFWEIEKSCLVAALNTNGVIPISYEVATLFCTSQRKHFRIICLLSPLAIVVILLKLQWSGMPCLGSRSHNITK